MNEKKEKIPMYQAIADDIKRRIAEREWQIDEPLPTQIELAEQYKTSEITSRRALSDLVQEGIIYRVRGKGSFVKELISESSLQPIRTIYFVHFNEVVSTYDHRYFVETLEGCKAVCDQHGINFYMLECGPNGNLPDDPAAAFIILTSDGLSQDLMVKWRDQGRRMVCIHFYFPHLNVPYVVVDNLTGGYFATEHLLALGHKRIGIILTGNSLLDMNQEFSLRFQGYKLALSQHRLPLDTTLVSVQVGNTEDHRMGYKGLKALMQNEDPPTAIFSTSDHKAFGVMKAAKEMGLRIPEDLSVVGYDDVFMSEYTQPGLTTINQNTKRLGGRAVEILLFELQNPPPVKDEIVPKLIDRGSTSMLRI